MRRLCITLAAGLLLAAPSAADASACADADLEPGPGAIGRARAATQCLINEERAAHGLRPLRTSRVLQRSATRHARDMVARQFFAHETPEGRGLASRLRSVRYQPLVASENLGALSDMGATPRAMVAAWMNSGVHRANILTGAFRQLGLGIVLGTPLGGTGATYAADFGAR